MVAAGAVGLATAGFLSCAISLPPLVIQIQQRNLPCSVLLISVFAANIIYATNALIWNSTDYASWWDGRIFCDVQIRLLVAIQVAVLGAASCIFRRLSQAFYLSQSLPTKYQKLRTKVIELTLCIFIPVLKMILVYIVQPDRYWIIRTKGCGLVVDGSWPTYVLMYIWIPVLAITALVYAAITTVRMVRHRRNTNSILRQGQSRRDESRVIRLYCLGFILFLTLVPLEAYSLYYTLPRRLQPYSWSRIHPPDWSERIFILRSTQVYFWDVLVQWLRIFYSICIVILVGLAPDAVNSYKSWLAQFRVWQRRLSNSMSTPTRSRHDLANQYGNSTPLRTMGPHELGNLSIVRQHQEAV